VRAAVLAHLDRSIRRRAATKPLTSLFASSQAAFTSERKGGPVSLPRPLRSARSAALALAYATACISVFEVSAPHAATHEVVPAVSASLQSKALGGRLRFLVYVPAGYADDTRRYPAVYFLHGLPAGPSSYLSLGWVHAALERAGGEAILVVPQTTRQANGDPEYQNWGSGHDWQTALARELPAWIDAHYRTIASRAGRALVGVSAGGYGATIIGLHYPAEFSVIESWSGYFRPTDKTGQKTLELGSAKANAGADVEKLVPSLPAQFAAYPTFLAFYVGDADRTFVADNTTLDRDLSVSGVDHLFELYAGGHTVTLWKARAVTWLGLALAHLATAATV
jgi:enterochelin esterase-like enzyme